MLPSRTKQHKLGRLEPCIWREALFLAIKVLTKLALRRVLSTLLMLCDFLPKEIRSFHIQRFRFRLIVLGLQGSSSGYSSYYRILLFLLLIVIVIGITLLVIKGDVGEVQKFLTKQYTNMVAFAQKKYQKLKSHVSWFKIANIIK